MSFLQLSKIVGSVAVFFGIFGVSYQKGMILGMNIGNLSGNYEVREVFNSALMGCLHLFDKLADKNIFIALQKNIIELSIAFLVVGLFFSFLYQKREDILDFTKSKSLADRVKAIGERILSSYIISGFVGLVSGGIFALVSLLFSYAFILALGVLILPSLFGYLVGFSKVESMKDSNPCISVSQEQVSESRYVNQCTHFMIKGKMIRGDLVLENTNGYFLHLNSSFLYVSKDGDTCIYSKYLKGSDAEQKLKADNKLEFEKDYIDSFCSKIAS